LRWKTLAHKYWELVNNNELMALGGQVAYYLILSFFPLLIFLLTLAGYADLSSERVFENFKYLIPEEVYLIIEKIIYEVFSVRSAGLLSFGMLGAFWASMNGVNALTRGMVKAYGIKEKRNLIRLLLSSIVILVIITFTVIISLLFQLMGENLAASLFPFLWFYLRLPVQVMFLIIVLIVLNRMATNSGYTSRMVLPGSLFTALGLVVLSMAISLYFRHFNTFSVIYGSIGGIMILLLWLYWSCEILLLGCALNSVLINYRLEKSKVAK